MERVKTTLDNKYLDGWIPKLNVNHFLFKTDSFLKTYVVNGCMAGNIINNWAHHYNINQKLILITLQKEQGLLSKKTLSEAMQTYNRIDGVEVSHLDAACGCGMWDSKTRKDCLGFPKQIELACKCYRDWYNVFKPDTPCKLINEHDVIPETAITLAFLKYTPHLSVLKKYEELFEQYFTQFNGW